MRNIAKLFGVVVVLVLAFVFINKITDNRFGDEMYENVYAGNGGKTVAYIDIDDTRTEFTDFEKAMEFAVNQKETSYCTIYVVKDCYIKNTIHISSGKIIEIVPVGKVMISRFSDECYEFTGTMFHVSKLSTLKLGKIDNKEENTLDINGGAEWKNDSMDYNFGIQANAPLITMNDANVSIYKEVSLINNCNNTTGKGGAILEESGVLNIYGANIKCNYAKSGSAIYVMDGKLNVDSITVTSNYDTEMGCVVADCDAEVNIKGELYIYDNINNKNVYLNKNYLNIVGKINGKIGVVAEKQAAGTLIAYSNNEKWLAKEYFIYKNDLGMCELLQFSDSTLRIGVQTKVFIEMDNLGEYIYSGKAPKIKYYLKEYGVQKGNVLGIDKCVANYYEVENGDKGKLLEGCPTKVGDYVIEVVYYGNVIKGFSPSSSSAMFSIIKEDLDEGDYSYKLDVKQSTRNKNTTDACIDIIIDDDSKKYFDIKISNTTIKRVLENAQLKNLAVNNNVTLKIKLICESQNENLGIILTSKSLETILDFDVYSLCFETNKDFVDIKNNALYNIYNRTNRDVTIRKVKIQQEDLAKSIQYCINDRPVYKYSITYKNFINNKSVLESIDEFDYRDIQIGIYYDKYNSNNVVDMLDIPVLKDNDMYFIQVQDKDILYNRHDKYLSSECVYILDTDKLGIIGLGRKDMRNNYEDVVNHWAEREINFMSDLGICVGINDDTFSPDAQMTRGMFLTAFGRMANVCLKTDIDMKAKSSFTDVNENSYYSPYINWAVNCDIVKGFENNKFYPDKPITREEMSVIINNFAEKLDYRLLIAKNDVEFKDGQDISKWAINSVSNMQRAGIIMGTADNEFKPQNTATRAQVCSVLYRFINIVLYI